MLSQANLLEVAEIRKVDNGHVAGTTTITTSAVDMQGYEAVCFVADLGTVTDGCVLSLTAQDCATSGGSYATIVDQAGNNVASSATASGSSNTVLATDIVRPQKRYVEGVLARGTQNAAVNTILAILYRAKAEPVKQGTTVLASYNGAATS